MKPLSSRNDPPSVVPKLPLGNASREALLRIGLLFNPPDSGFTSEFRQAELGSHSQAELGNDRATSAEWEKMIKSGGFVA